jgi:serine/threonine-protein kinase
VRAFACFALGTALVIAAAPARADDRAAAQVLFEQGRDLVKKGAFREACPKFAESLKLDRGIGTMLWLADCQQNIGQTASAWATFKEAAAAAALSGDSREKVARDRANNLAPKLSRLTINVPSPAAASLEVKLDGVVTGPAEWGVPVPVDPGTHAIEARSPGRVAWSKSVTVADGAQTVVVDIPSLAVEPEWQKPAPEPTPPPVAPPPRPPPVTPEPVDPHRGRTQRILGVGLGALGVVGLGVGAFFSFHAKSTYDASNGNGHCNANNQCDQVGTTDRNDAKSQATVATIVLGAGLVALAGGIVLYLTAPKSAPAAFRSDALIRF